MTTEVGVRQDAPDRSGESSLRAIIANTFDTIAIIDAHGRIMYEGPSVERVLGLDPRKRHARSAFEHIHPDDLDRARGILRDLVTGRRRHVRAELRIRHQQGNYRLLDTSATSLLDDPNVGGIVIVARDITEQRTVELEHARLLDRERRSQAAVEHALDQLLNLQSVADLLGTAITAESVVAIAVERGAATVGAIGGAVGLLTPSRESVDI